MDHQDDNAGRFEARIASRRIIDIEVDHFDTEADAKAWIRAGRRRRDREGVDLKSLECTVCRV